MDEENFSFFNLLLAVSSDLQHKPSISYSRYSKQIAIAMDEENFSFFNLSDDEIFNEMQNRALTAGAIGYGIVADGSDDILFFESEEQITEFLLRYD